MANNVLIIEQIVQKIMRDGESERERERDIYIYIYTKKKGSTIYVSNCAYLKLVHMHLSERVFHGGLIVHEYNATRFRISVH